MRIVFTGKNFKQGLKEIDPTSLASVGEANRKQDPARQ